MNSFSTARRSFIVAALAVVLALAFAAVGTTVAATNVLTNGSFESGNNPPTGWTVGGPTGIDVVHSSGWAPSQGSYSIDLNAFDPGTVSQTFATYPGGDYTVTFDLAGNPGHGGVVELEVGGAGQSATSTFDTAGHSETSMGWTPSSFDFTAISGSTTLTFTSLTSGSSSCPIFEACGPALDNIAVWYTNQAPVLSVNGSVTYTEDAAPVPMAPGLTLTDLEDDNIDGAKVSIGAGFDASQDSLAISGPLPAGLSASYNAVAGVLTISGVASPADYQQVLRQVTFSNNSQNPAAVPRTVTFNVGTSLAFGDNGHFYEFVSATGIKWADSVSGADARSLYGLQGYLATITSAAENSFVVTKVQGNGWLGGTDSAVEGTWRWVTGPESGQVLAYTNWDAGEPNNCCGGEDYVHMLGNPGFGSRVGKWNDLYDHTDQGSLYRPLGYVVEYGGMPGDPALQLSGDVMVNVQPVNDPPTASAGGPYSVDEGSSITLIGSGSDIDSAGVSYAWDLDDNGSFETVGQSVIFNALDGPGTPTVSLQVCDTGTPGVACTVATAAVTVNNVAPGLTVNVGSTNTVYYVDWTSADPGAGTASGVINLPGGSTVNVTFEALNPDDTPSFFYGAQTSGGTDYWSPSAPYISAEVPNEPPTSDIIQLSGGNSTVYKVTLSQPIVDPIMAIVSLGSGGNTITYDFNSPFAIVSQDAGYWGGCATCLAQL